MYSRSRLRIETKEKKDEKPGCFVVTAFFAFIAILFWKWVRPTAIPFELFEFWQFKGTWGEVFVMSWPIFVWGTVITLIFAVAQRNDPETNRKAEANLGKGFLVSLGAGVLEEICFRWILFYNEIVGFKIANFILLGFMNINIVKWLYEHVTGPVANFFTLGQLEPLLFSSLGWAVGAAIIGSNGKFRNGHAYQGCFGYINSWFIGMFMFVLMFKFGLVAAIVVHFLYDLFIFIVLYIDSVFERSLGWA